MPSEKNISPAVTPATPASHRSRWAKVIAGLVVSALCLWFAVRDMLKDPDAWEKIVEAFRNANYASIPAIFAILIVFYWLKAVRWQLLLSPVGKYRPVRDLVGPIMIGFGFNNLLPLRIGEFLRGHVLAKQQRLSLTVALSSLVLERIFDGMAIVIYLSIGLLFVQGLDPQIQQGAMIFSAVAACMVIGALIYVIWTGPFVSIVERVLKRLPLLPHSVTDRICRILEKGAYGLASLKNPRLVAVIILISMIKWALNGVLILLSLWSFGLPHTLPIGMVMQGAIAFGIAIPSSPGFIGVMQLIFMSVMKFFTADQEGVFASSIYYQFTQWVPVSLAGVLFALNFLWRGDLDLKTVEAQLEGDSEEDAVDVPPASSATPAAGDSAISR